MIGLHNSRHPLDQSDARVRSISSLLPSFSRASLNLVWLLEIFVFALIGLNEHFGCGFTIANRGVLEMKFNPFHPNISMHILRTVLYTFPKALTRGICLKIKRFVSWWSFPWFSWPKCLIQGWYCEEKFEAGHSLRLKVKLIPNNLCILCRIVSNYN